MSLPDDYWYKQAQRAGCSEADMRRQLDRAWEHINQLGEQLRSRGLEAGDLTAHIDSLAAIDVSNEIAARRGNESRMAMVSIVHDGQDALDKSCDPQTVCQATFRRLLALNDRWKSAGSMEEARAIVAERRRDITVYTYDAAAS